MLTLSSGASAADSGHPRAQPGKDRGPCRAFLTGLSRPAVSVAVQSQATGQVEAFRAVLPWLPCTAEELGKQERGVVM